MKIDRVMDRLVEADMGVGSVAFACYLSTLPQKPTLELVTDGFMICYTRFLGLYIYRRGDNVYCCQMNGDLSEDHPFGNQLLANTLFNSLINELLVA